MTPAERKVVEAARDALRALFPVEPHCRVVNLHEQIAPCPGCAERDARLLDFAHELTAVNECVVEKDRLVAERDARIAALERDRDEARAKERDGWLELEKRGQAIADAMGRNRGTDALVSAVRTLSRDHDNYYERAKCEQARAEAALGRVEASLDKERKALREAGRQLLAAEGLSDLLRTALERARDWIMGDRKTYYIGVLAEIDAAIALATAKT